MGLALLNVEFSRSHSDTPQSVGLLWTSEKPDAETRLSKWHIKFSAYVTENTVRVHYKVRLLMLSREMIVIRYERHKELISILW